MAYTELGSTFCWNSSMSTFTVLVPSTRLPLSVVSRVTYFGTVAPSSAVWGVVTEGAVYALTCSGWPSLVQPSAAAPASPSEAVRANNVRT